MERWNTKLGKHIENKKIDNFLVEIASVCIKHRLSLSHEDHHGAFEVVDINKENLDWLSDAHDCTEL